MIFVKNNLKILFLFTLVFFFYISNARALTYIDSASIDWSVTLYGESNSDADECKDGPTVCNTSVSASTSSRGPWVTNQSIASTGDNKQIQACLNNRASGINPSCPSSPSNNCKVVGKIRYKTRTPTCVPTVDCGSIYDSYCGIVVNCPFVPTATMK